MIHFPAITSVDLNPVKVFEMGKGSCVVDCKLFLGSPENPDP
jgi:hypothetical protein